MNIYRKTTAESKLLTLLIATCIILLISPVSALAQQAEADSLLNSSHVTSWAYFRDPNLNIWYISHPLGTTYGLGSNNSNHISWVALANEGAVASLDFLNKRVSLSSSTAALTPSDSFLAISLVGGEAKQYVYNNTANQWASLIAGYTLDMDWYFFQVASTGKWYIVWINGTDSTIYRLKLNSSLDNYDWQRPLDGSGVAVDTSSWTKEFFQENGIWKVRFSAPAVTATSGFGWPLLYPNKNTSTNNEFCSGGWCNNDGNYFSAYDTVSYAYPVYHPGEDWNVPGILGGYNATGCSSDEGLDVVATANGEVVYANTSDWGGIVIKHIYQGVTWYSQYGHIFNAAVTVGQVVAKGQNIAKIGDVGTLCAHLHFEIRKENHPNPTYGPYWIYGSTGLGNLANVTNWYEDPDAFIPSHPAY